MSHYLQNGTSFVPCDPAKLNVKALLPAGTFTIGVDPRDNSFFFAKIDDFDMPKRLYGDTTKDAARIMSTFQSRPNSTGVLLTGEKGSGKSLLLKLLAVQAQALGMPTIVINAAYAGDPFFQLIQGLEQPAVIAFDEFEKVYDHKGQEAMLTLLDGMFPSKKLFVLTCNDEFRVNDHMKNRPGRIFYMKEFKGLSQDFVAEYCAENLKNKAYAYNVSIVASMFAEFNFDMLKALVEEMNRYDEPASEAMKMLNIKPYSDASASYTSELWLKGEKLEGEVHNSHEKGSPLATPRMWLEFTPAGKRKKKVAPSPLGGGALADFLATAGDDDDEDSTSVSLVFTPVDQLVRMDPIEGIMEFLDPEKGLTLKMIRRKAAAALPSPW